MIKWLFLLLPLSLLAQQTKTSSFPNGYWLTPRIELELPDSSNLFLEGNWRFQFANSINQTYRKYAELGYHRPMDNFRVGTSGKLIKSTVRQAMFKLYGGHESTILGHSLNKTFLIEYLYEYEDGNPNTINNPYGRWSIELDLAKQYDIGLGYHLAVRPFQIFEIKNPKIHSYDGRFFDLNRWSAEITYQYLKQNLFALFVMRETNYYWVSAQIPEFALNQHRLIFGLKYTLRLTPYDNN